MPLTQSSDSMLPVSVASLCKVQYLEVALYVKLVQGGLAADCLSQR